MTPSNVQISAGLIKNVLRGRPVTASIMWEARKYAMNGNMSIIKGSRSRAATGCPRLSWCRALRVPHPGQ
jgi:hypothetical protein